MRSAKTLLKMNKKEIQQQLPDWYDGEVYEIGDEVSNPFSGEKVMLDAAELSMYDCIKGAELAYTANAGAFDIEECFDIINQGKDWFLAKNPKAYMTLLD